MVALTWTVARAIALLTLVNTSTAGAVPSDAGPDVPEEFVNEVLAYFQARSVGVTPKRNVLMANGVEKRVPADHGCQDGSHWIERTCMTDVGPRDYEDECQDADGDIYRVEGECPEFTSCEEVIVNVAGGGTEDDIICVPSTPPKQDNVSTKGQYGYRNIQAGSASNTQIDEAITLLENVAGASTSGHVRSHDRSFVISPNNIIKANLHGHVLNLCTQNRGDPKNSRQCQPTRRHDFSKNDVVDFTFGLADGQSGIMFYSIQHK
ncbi:hypothetical protein HJFPF1_07226 [Paramyrothecium foliicola]|nr:hypothetical protein HJFPF1_07226 [Paramyrothecium foliicola]